MALIKCPECGNMVSDKATKCPGCGIKVKTILKMQESIATDLNTEDSSEVSSDTFKATKQPIKPKKRIDTQEYKKLLLVALPVIILIVVLIVTLDIAIHWKSYKTDGTFKKIYDRIGVCVSHDYADATCDTPSTCNICGKTKGDVLGHDYVLLSTVDSTCTEEGKETYECSRCGASKDSRLPALGHDYTGEPEIIEPTCTENGKSINKCSRCGEIVEEIISATGHELTEATCTAPSMCTICGEIVGEPLGHTTLNGICDRCGEEIHEPIEFSGTGDTVLSDLPIPQGSYKVHFTNTGSSNFIIHAYTAAGDKTNWMNEIGPFSGDIYTNTNLEKGLIEIKSNGDWTIKFEDILDGGTSNIQGTGYCLTPYFTLKEGTLTVDISNTNARSNFISYLYDENGNKYSLTNEIGDYSGQKVFNKGRAGTKYCLWVRSDGVWSFDFGIGDSVTVVSNVEK